MSWQRVSSLARARLPAPNPTSTVPIGRRLLPRTTFAYIPDSSSSIIHSLRGVVRRCLSAPLDQITSTRWPPSCAQLCFARHLLLHHRAPFPPPSPPSDHKLLGLCNSPSLLALHLQSMPGLLHFTLLQSALSFHHFHVRDIRYSSIVK